MTMRKQPSTKGTLISRPKYAADIKTRITKASTSAAISAMLSMNLNMKLTQIPEKPPSEIISIGSVENMS